MTGDDLELSIPPAALFIMCAVFMNLAGRFLPFATIAFAGQLWIMGVLVVAGALCIAAGVISFRRHRTSVDPRDPSVASTLVDSGIFAITRNPMYLGMALALFGIAAGIGNWIALALPLLFLVWIDRLQIAPEERALEQSFGQTYSAYRQRTRRWL